MVWLARHSNSHEKILNESLQNRRSAVIELINKLDAKSSQLKVLKLHAQSKFAKRLAAIYAMRDDINKRFELKW